MRVSARTLSLVRILLGSCGSRGSGSSQSSQPTQLGHEFDGNRYLKSFYLHPADADDYRCDKQMFKRIIDLF